MASRTMKAIKVISDHKAEIQDVPLPQLRDDYVLAKVTCVALNPTDWKHIDHIGAVGSTVGCDFSGVIEEVGPKVTKAWKKGDRIASFVHGCNASELEDGCFAEYCVAKGDIGVKIPDSISDEDASTLGVGVTTVGQGLYQSLGLPLPGSGSHGGYLLVYGGSTATGTLAIQYAALSGCKVIATCSPHNYGLVKALGAEEAFDYKDPECASKIRAYTKDTLTLVYDTIAEGSSPKICEDSVSSTGGTICSLLPAKHSRDDIVSKHMLGYTVTGESFWFINRDFPAQPQDLEFGRSFWELSSGLLEEGKVKPHPVTVGKGGLNGVFDGLQQFREGKVSGVKLVYRVGDTQ